jgi:hypothetical protein
MEIISQSTNTINYPHWLDNYRILKSKYKIRYDDNMYTDIATNVFLSMFDYDERIYRPELFDMILHDFGVCALVKTSVSDYTPCYCNMIGGDRYPDGMFKDVQCIFLDGNSLVFSDWLNNPNVFVFFNNHTKTPDCFIEKYAYLLTNCDTSLDLNVKFSRKKPIPVARDKKSKNQIDTIFSDLDNGVVKTVLTEPTVDELIGDNKPFDVINITEVESSRYIANLSQLHDNLISRLFFHMGLSMNDMNKQAQITEAELNKNKSVALAFVESWKTPRSFGFKEIKRKTGVELSFKLSRLWEAELKEQLFTEQDKESASQLANPESGDNDENE